MMNYKKWSSFFYNIGRGKNYNTNQKKISSVNMSILFCYFFIYPYIIYILIYITSTPPMPNKTAHGLLSLSATIITFWFFLWFIYFSFFTTRELLVHHVISQQEYLDSHDRWQYESCEDDVRWLFESKWDSFIYHGNVIQNNNEGQLQYVKICQEKATNKLLLKRDVDFQRAMSKYGLATVFFLILFLSFSIQSTLIYKKNK